MPPSSQIGLKGLAGTVQIGTETELEHSCLDGNLNEKDGDMNENFEYYRGQPVEP